MCHVADMVEEAGCSVSEWQFAYAYGARPGLRSIVFRCCILHADHVSVISIAI